MSELPLNLTGDEKDLLLRLLNSALGDTRVEVHHTHYSPEYRDKVKKEEEMIRGLLAKLS